MIALTEKAGRERSAGGLPSYRRSRLGCRRGGVAAVAGRAAGPKAGTALHVTPSPGSRPTPTVFHDAPSSPGAIPHPPSRPPLPIPETHEGTQIAGTCGGVCVGLDTTELSTPPEKSSLDNLVGEDPVTPSRG